MATARLVRTGRVGRQARVMSHRARSALAKSPVEVADSVASVVGAAFAAWADRFVSAVVRDVVQPSDRFKQDTSRTEHVQLGTAIGTATDVPTLGTQGSASESERSVHVERAAPNRHLSGLTLLHGGAADFEAHGERYGLHAQDERQGSARLERSDATVRGLFDEAGKAKPDPDKIRAAFNVLESKSADELRVNGVPTRTVLTGAERLQADWLRANTDLIKAESDLRRRVERVLQDPLNEGRSVADISKLLQEQAGYSQSRAELTARDQTLKMYGQIQEQRQTNAGITRYVWTTSLDERVRPDHADLDGSIQSWDDPPIVDQRTGRRGHPGIDFQCRCTAVPVLDEDDVADPAPAQAQAQLRAQAVAEGRAQAPRTPTPAPRAPARRPPPEPVMTPTRAEVEAERRRVEAEQARLRAEAEADRRIAAAKAEAEAAARIEAARIEAARQARAEAEANQRAAEAARRRIEAERRTARKPAERVEVHPDVTQTARTAIVDAVNQVNLPGLKSLEVTPRIPGNSANGDYSPWSGRLRVAAVREVKAKDLPDTPGPGRLWAISATGKTLDEAVRLTTLHEMGHHAHMWGVRRFEDGPAVASYAQSVAGLKADRIVEALFNNPKREYLTDYAGVAPGTQEMHRSSEYFAEAHAAYHAYPAWLRRVAPKAYEAVEEVLRLRREAGL